MTTTSLSVDDDRPTELPIARGPPRRRHVVVDGDELKPRDPRFDPRCSGSNDVRHFVRNYAFVDEIRRQEVQQLEEAFRRERDEEKRSKIKAAMQRMRNKMVERENKSKRIELVDQLKKMSKCPGNDHHHQNHTQEPTQQTAKQPYRKRFNNIKKSEIKKTLLVNKYKELKESGKLTKYLERKRKKLIQRDGKAFGGGD